MIEQLARTYNTPFKIQKFLRELNYNKAETLYSAKTVIQNRSAHCLEGAFTAAALMEQLGFEPMILSFESIDDLEHVVYIFETPTGYGSIGKSRDPGLHGRAPVFKSIRDLALSYYDPYVDSTGRITAFQIAHLDEIGVDWRHGSNNLWKADRYLVELPHIQLTKSRKTSDQRFRKLKKSYQKYGAIQHGPHWW